MLKNTTKELIVGSVFVSGERTKTWYQLQIQFLKKTTSNFKHYVFLNGDIDESIFTESEIVGHYNESAVKILDGSAQSNNHLIGLNAILAKFKTVNAHNYLILDCDCFPILDNWMPTLVDTMSSKDKSIASPIRTENLDIFPHPSALFMTKAALQSNWMDLSIGSKFNLMTNEIHDVGAKLPLKECYPLLRTNYFNPHPIFSAIYGHMFYHHTCGSRPKGMHTRGINEGASYYVKNHWAIEEILFERLQDNPEKLINKLLGDYTDLNKLKFKLA